MYGKLAFPAVAPFHAILCHSPLAGSSISILGNPVVLSKLTGGCLRAALFRMSNVAAGGADG